MKSTWLLAVGIAIGMLGMSTYLTVSKPSGAADGSDPHEMGSPGSSVGREIRNHKPLWPRLKPTRTVAHEVASPSTERLPEVTRPQVGGSRPDAAAVEPTREELVIAAERINHHASRKLARLAHLLDLSEAQQDQIFPLLARSAPAYHPSLAIEVGGATVAGRRDLRSSNSASNEGAEEQTPAGSEPNDPLPASKADEKIHEALTSEQQRKLEDELVEEDLWWTEIIADLEDELDESPPAATPMGPEPVETSYQGNTGIGRLLQQAAEQEAAAGSGDAAPATENPSAGRARGL